MKNMGLPKDFADCVFCSFKVIGDDVLLYFFFFLINVLLLIYIPTLILFSYNLYMFIQGLPFLSFLYKMKC